MQNYHRAPLDARIDIYGLSDAIKTFKTIRFTSLYHLSLKDIPLYGAELYVAKLYVRRKVSSTLPRQSYVFETPPGGKKTKKEKEKEKTWR